MSLNDLDWVETPTGERLHRAILSPLEDAILNDNGQLGGGGITLACGRTVEAVYIPGVGSRMGSRRCGTCCVRSGLPLGTGSPKNDPACRRILGLDGAA